LANGKLLEALFSSDSIENKRNTEAVEIGPSQMAAARVTPYAAARTLPLDEVRPRVRSLYVAEKSAELARKEGEAKLAAWKAAPNNAAGLQPAIVVSRDQPQNLPRAVVDAVLGASTATLPAWVGVDLGAQGYAVAKVNRLVPRAAPNEQTARQERQQYLQWLSNAEGLAYYELLKDRFKVQIKAPRPQSMPG
jgi:peptidyl-prolyl cis-trans isomerase D